MIINVCLEQPLDYEFHYSINANACRKRNRFVHPHRQGHRIKWVGADLAQNKIIQIVFDSAADCPYEWDDGTQWDDNGTTGNFPPPHGIQGAVVKANWPLDQYYIPTKYEVIVLDVGPNHDNPSDDPEVILTDADDGIEDIALITKLELVGIGALAGMGAGLALGAFLKYVKRRG